MTDFSSQFGIKPLSEGDILDMKKKLQSLDQKELDTYYVTFVKHVHNIFNTIIKHTKKEHEDDLVEIERLKRILKFIPDDEIFLRSKDKIWAVRVVILNSDANWFLEQDFSTMVKKDENHDLINSLINLIKIKFIKLEQDEKDIYWNFLRQLVLVIANFKKLTGEYVK